MNQKTISQQVAPQATLHTLEALRHFTHKSMFKYKALFDSNMIGVASTDFEDTIINANDAFLSIIGYTQEDVAKGTVRWSTISPSKYNDADIEKINELLTHKTIIPFEKEYIHKDGYSIPVLVGAEAMDDSLTHGVCFALDISELKELERKKDDFIGMVSHELKTPLSIMKLYGDFLEKAIEDGASKSELLESTNEIQSQVDKLNVLINDLLNMARYQSSESVFATSAIELTGTIKHVVDELSLLRGRTIRFGGTEIIYVNANIDRLSQVIINLVNNALRYSSTSTDITVGVHRDTECAYIDVIDKGMGISEENKSKIFERYYRINHADDYDDEGAGIGLFISNEIIKHHGGKLSVESELGKGSTFTISLPLIH